MKYKLVLFSPWLLKSPVKEGPGASRTLADLPRWPSCRSVLVTVNVGT